jgi:hypothetical protein
MNKEAWKVDDPGWVKSRKKEWLYVKKSLEVMKGNIKVKAIKPLREYFLTGELPPEKDQRYILNNRFLLIRLWFHPDSSTETFQRLVDETPKKFELDYAKTVFFKYQTGGYDFQPPYYFMGGKEKALARFFVPSEITDECLESSYENFIQPVRFINGYFSRTIRFLTSESEDHNFLAYQYLIDYLDSCIQKFGDQADYLRRKKHEPTLEVWLNLMASFDKNTIPDTRAENAESFVRKVREGLQAGRFGDRLQEIWKSIEKA